MSELSVRKLARPDAGWRFNLYPDAGEGSGGFASSSRRVPDYVARGAARDPERAAQEAGRRARARLRRYCAANRLNRLGTLTYADANHDPVLVREHLGEFFRALRDLLGGEALPYAWVPEWHKSGHGLHAHFAVGRYVKRSLIVEAWGRGFVHIKLIGSPVGTGALGESRIAASYLSKYVAKSFLETEGRTLGLHRYDVGQGFRPRVVALDGRSSADVLEQASGLLGGELPSVEWSSSQSADWAGPPAVWAQWGR